MTRPKTARPTRRYYIEFKQPSGAWAVFQRTNDINEAWQVAKIQSSQYRKRDWRIRDTEKVALYYLPFSDGRAVGTVWLTEQ